MYPFVDLDNMQTPIDVVGGDDKEEDKDDDYSDDDDDNDSDEGSDANDDDIDDEDNLVDDVEVNGVASKNGSQIVIVDEEDDGGVANGKEADGKRKRNMSYDPNALPPPLPSRQVIPKVLASIQALNFSFVLLATSASIVFVLFVILMKLTSDIYASYLHCRKRVGIYPTGWV